MTSFGPIAPHYDLLMSAIPYEMWYEYYTLLLLSQGVEPKTVLDVCCGTGSVCEILTEHGYLMTGFDLSAAMIESANEKRVQKGLVIDYRVADAANFDFGTKFDAAFSFFDSLNYITSLEGLRNAMQCVANHLPAGASWVFDVNTAYAFEKEMFTQSDVRRNAPIKYDWLGNYDPSTRIIEVDMKFWRGDEELHEVHIQRAHSDEEIREALRDAGFTDVRRYHSYTLDKPRKNSDRVHYACLRAG